MNRSEIHIGDLVWVDTHKHGRVIALRESQTGSGVVADIISKTNRMFTAVDIDRLRLDIRGSVKVIDGSGQ